MERFSKPDESGELSEIKSEREPTSYEEALAAAAHLYVAGENPFDDIQHPVSLKLLDTVRVWEA
jgi:hypothetical protein